METVVLLLACLCATAASALSQNDEQCHVYYGGLVFPEGTRRPIEHGLHWSKTQSKRARARMAGRSLLIHVAAHRGCAVV